jgi:hypothetical protein
MTPFQLQKSTPAISHPVLFRVRVKVTAIRSGWMRW